MIEILFNSLLAGLLVSPILAMITPRSKSGRYLSAAVLFGALVAGSCAAFEILLWNLRHTVSIYWLSPFPFSLAVDRLSAFFLLLICSVSVPVVLYSSSYIGRHYSVQRQGWFWSLLPLFLLSMVLVVTADTAFAFLFEWELMTLASAALVMLDGCEGERRRNIFIYLLMMHAGAAAVFGAFLAFLPNTGMLEFDSLRMTAPFLSPAVRTAIFLLAFIGFGTKAGIVPLHLWLPKAHPIAPSPVSALMSGVMLKTAVYGFIRVNFDLLGGGPSWWGYVVLAAGAVSALLGVLYALSERDLKRLLAYSSVENIGIIYLCLGAAMVFSAGELSQWAMLALTAALLHSLNHALFKTLLFLGAGAISDSTHTLDLDRLGGLFQKMRFSATMFLIACCSIAGLPLFSGFASEWLAFRTFIAGAELPGAGASIVLLLSAGVLALVGGLAASCFAQVYSAAFLGRPRSQESARAHEVTQPMQIAMALLAAACVFIGVAPSLLVDLVAPVAQHLIAGSMSFAASDLLLSFLPWIAVFVLIIIALWLVIPRVTRITPTWACGMPGLDGRMQYTATALSKPLRKVFAAVYRPDRTVKILPADQPFFPASISYRSVRTTSFERSLYRPAVDTVVLAAKRLRRMQTGNIQIYLLYMFLALVVALICMRFV